MKTKKFLFVLLMMVCTFIYVQAQSIDRMSIGPRGGINLANVTGVEQSQTVTTAVLGLTTTYSFETHSGLTVDLLYSVEGYKAPFETYKLRYLQVPVYFDYFFGKLGQPFRPKIYVGVSPAFFLGGTLNELDVNQPYFNKFIVHATGGFGFNYRVANRIWLNADGRFFYGLSDIRSKNYAVGDPIQPRIFQATIGLAYGLAKL